MQINKSKPSVPVFSIEEVNQFRINTPGSYEVLHFNNAGAALMPSSVIEAQINHLQLESIMGGYEAAKFRKNEIADAYHQVGILLNCNSSNIAFTSSATDAFSKALSSIHFEKEDVILTDQDGYVSNQIQFLSLVKRVGVKLVYIENELTGGIDLNDLQNKLESYQPKLLSISHIPTNSGLVQPVLAIAGVFEAYQKKHPNKTWYILDACQSAGQMKLDAIKLQCHFLSFTFRKFLRGPRGVGALFVADAVLENKLEPLFIDMRGAEWKEKDIYLPATSAIRFEDWEFNYAAILGARESVIYALSIGEDRIWSQLQFLSVYMRNALKNIPNLILLDKGMELGALITFYVKGADPVQLQTELNTAKINTSISYRAYGLIDFDEKGVTWAIRASPHYYNTIEEIDLLVSTLKANLSDK
jgi:selenocysteine lyase/cysteine desulfurase